MPKGPRSVYSRAVNDDRSLIFWPHPRGLRLAAALAIGATAWTAALGAESSPTSTNKPPVPTGVAIAVTVADETKWYGLAPGAFAALPEAQKTIQLSALDRRLLAAAIHHATNQERAKNQLPPLQYEPAAAEAARLQADVMAKEKFLGHENDFDPALKTPLNRVRKVGLKPRFIAENVALDFARQYRSGDTFYTRSVDGETVFSAVPDGPPLPMHTYASFAATLLDGWMHSPDHRANILSDKPQRLGCSGAPSRDSTGLEVFYCTQVFFTPAADPKPD